MLKVALIEGADHHEVVNIFARCLAINNIEVHIFARQKLKAYFEEILEDSSSILFHFSPESTSFDAFLKNNKSLIESCNARLVCTLETHDGGTVDLSHLPNTFLYIHLANYSFQSPHSIPWSLSYRGLIRIIKYVKDSLLDHKINTYQETVKAYKKHLVASPSVKDYLIKALNLDDSKIAVAPFYAVFPAHSEQKKPFKVVIPGTVNSRRDYVVVKNAFDFLGEKYNIELYLLGNVKTKETIPELNSIATKYPNISINYSLNGYDAIAYEHHLRTAAFGIIPITDSHDILCFEEFEGKTQISGALNDVCRTRLPFIFPANIQLPYELKSVSLTYTNAQTLATQITKMFEGGSSFLSHEYEILSTKIDLKQRGLELLKVLGLP